MTPVDASISLLYFSMFLCIMCIICSYTIFFFKQKTAYEMRISDWSSDVCSSDLTHQQRATMTCHARSPQSKNMDLSCRRIGKLYERDNGIRHARRDRKSVG